MNRLAIATVAMAALLLASPTRAERDFSQKDSAGSPAGIQLDSGALSVRLSGRAMVQMALLTGDDTLLSDGDMAEDEGFRLRRARLGVTATYDHHLSVGVVIDLMESHGTSLHEAYIGWDTRFALLHAGLVKAPMSRSALVSSQNLQMAERAIGIKAMAPFQQLGLMAGGNIWDSKIRLLVGMYNGMDREDTFAGGYARINPGVGNRFGGYALSSRLDIEPLGLLGPGAADLTHSKKPLLGLGGGVLFNAGETIKSMSYSGDLAFKWYGVSLLAEYIADSAEPVSEPSTDATIEAKTKRSALLTQLGYAAIKNVLDVSARFEMIDENADVDNEGDYFAIGGCASVYLYEGHFKLQLYYQHRMERHGASLDNDVFALQGEGRF